jgi:hypothetical protein
MVDIMVIALLLGEAIINPTTITTAIVIVKQI